MIDWPEGRQWAEFAMASVANKSNCNTDKSVSMGSMETFAALCINDWCADGVDGSCTIGVLMRHTAAGPVTL